MERLEKHEYRAAAGGAALRAAFSATIPVLTGYIPLGMAYGFLMASIGYGPLWALGMSMVVFGGSIEYMAVTLLTSAFAPVQAFLIAVMINARHIFLRPGPAGQVPRPGQGPPVSDFRPDGRDVLPGLHPGAAGDR